MEMRLMLVPLLMTSGWLSTLVDGFSRGPPVTFCQGMEPNHGDTENGLTDPPFNITSGADDCYIPGQSITVTLYALTPRTFKGFFVQARRPNVDSLSYGTFDFDGNVDDFRTIDCFGNEHSAISHSDSVDKTRAVFTWTPPTNLFDGIELVATVVENFQAYWAGRLRVRLQRCPQTAMASTPSASDLDSFQPTTVESINPDHTYADKGHSSSTSTATRLAPFLFADVRAMPDVRVSLQLFMIGVLVRLRWS